MGIGQPPGDLAPGTPPQAAATTALAAQVAAALSPPDLQVHETIGWTNPATRGRITTSGWQAAGLVVANRRRTPIVLSTTASPAAGAGQYAWIVDGFTEAVIRLPGSGARSVFWAKVAAIPATVVPAGSVELYLSSLAPRTPFSSRPIPGAWSVSAPAGATDASGTLTWHGSPPFSLDGPARLARAGWMVTTLSTTAGSLTIWLPATNAVGVTAFVVPISPDVYDAGEYAFDPPVACSAVLGGDFNAGRYDYKGTSTGTKVSLIFTFA